MDDKISEHLPAKTELDVFIEFIYDNGWYVAMATCLPVSIGTIKKQWDAHIKGENNG
jgi:hypothetical protein